MPNLYDEAIADAKALKEMAERNARNKIIESISPQIRRMVERQILAEQDDDAAEEVPNLDLEPLPDDPAVAGTAAPAMAAPAMSAPGGPAPDPDEEVTHTVTTKTASGTEVKINVRVDKHGEASATADSDVAEGDDVDVTMNEESMQALADMVLGYRRQERMSLGKIRRQFESLKRVSGKLPLTESANFRSAYAILVKNVDDFRNHIISNGSSPVVRKKFNSIVKEIRDMSTNARFRRLLEEMERRPRLRNEAKLVFEPADLEGLDDTVKEKLRAMTFSVDLGDEDAEAAAGAEMPVDVADTGAGAPVDAAAAAAPAAPPAPSEYDLEEEMYDEMDDMMGEDEYTEMDSDLEEMDNDLDEMDDAYEAEDMEHDEGKTFHVDESMLRRELRRLREAKGSKGKNAKGIKDPKAKHFGGGDVEGLPDELNHLSEAEVEKELEEAEEVAAKALEVAKKATGAAKEERKARVEEARMNRALKSKLVEAAKEAVALREQLEEVNLFNAKLLYVNKLMQNRDLTPRQQRAIVESLDAAKSVREAKLLYTSLTESLKTKSGTMTEGRILGSSSRSTRSASPAASLNESVEVDRWAVLAGIKSGK
jgi:hypothetical protein